MLPSASWGTITNLAAKPTPRPEQGPLRQVNAWPVQRFLLCSGLSGLVPGRYNAARRSVRWSGAGDHRQGDVGRADGRLGGEAGITG
jgi:hypothetical protein